MFLLKLNSFANNKDAMIGLENKNEEESKINQTSEVASASQVKQIKAKKAGGKKMKINLQKKQK